MGAEFAEINGVVLSQDLSVEERPIVRIRCDGECVLLQGDVVIMVEVLTEWLRYAQRIE